MHDDSWNKMYKNQIMNKTENTIKALHWKRMIPTSNTAIATVWNDCPRKSLANREQQK